MMRHRSRLWVAAAFSIALLAAACWPVTTRYGIDYQIYSKTIPLYEKTLNFISRDIQFRRLSREVLEGARNDQEMVQKALDWVSRNIRAVPAGFPVVDDHVWNIVVRGYGADDQRTEVFALLASYGCCAAAAARLEEPNSKARLYVALVSLTGKTRVIDVVHGIVFRNQTGELSTVEDLLRTPGLITAAAGGLQPAGIPYDQYFAGLHELRPLFARMEQQKPWQRLKSEVAGLLTGRAN